MPTVLTIFATNDRAKQMRKRRYLQPFTSTTLLFLGLDLDNTQFFVCNCVFENVWSQVFSTPAVSKIGFALDIVNTLSLLSGVFGLNLQKRIFVCYLSHCPCKHFDSQTHCIYPKLIKKVTTAFQKEEQNVIAGGSSESWRQWTAAVKLKLALATCHVGHSQHCWIQSGYYLASGYLWTANMTWNWTHSHSKSQNASWYQQQSIYLAL